MENTVLYSKLIPPIPSKNYMRSVHLTKEFHKIHTCKLSILYSGAGYGKSSALAQFFADQHVLFSWYQMPEGDDGVLPFYGTFSIV